MLALIACLAIIAGTLVWQSRIVTPESLSKTLFSGVTYTRQVMRSPRPMIVHIVEVDLREPGIRFLVTPGDASAEMPLKARTTSQFLDEFGLQIAINGDGFTPWHSRTVLDYYPHSGDLVDPIGFAASKGLVYSQKTDAEPTLYFTKQNLARIGTATGKIENAISGNLLLVEKGSPLEGLGGEPEPRTAVALDKNSRRLILVVIDGRQPGYSEGATLDELANILTEQGAHSAINLDGGGSSTLVTEGKLGQPDTLNSPINHGIPGFQRPVGNHLGIYANP